MTDYEYGIDFHHYPVAEGHEAHRSGMTKEQAEQWIAEWRKDGGRTEAFSIILRPITEWEPA